MIHRTPKGAENPFTMADNQYITDPNLTAKAKGILLYMLSRPDDWTFYMSEIKQHFSDGESAIRSGIKELIEAGYIERSMIQNEQGRFEGYCYDIFERPQIKTVCGKSTNGKSHTTNIDNTKTDKTNKNIKTISIEIASLFNSEIGEVINLYFSIFKQKIGTEHPFIKKEHLFRIAEKLADLADEYRFTIDEWSDIINEYFKAYSHRSDCNIIHFASGDNLEILIKRVA